MLQFKRTTTYILVIILTIIILLNVYILLQCNYNSFQDYSFNSLQELSIDASSLTVIIREFEPFNNDLINTISNLSRHDSISKIILISDEYVYPPLNIKNKKLFFNILNVMPDPYHWEKHQLISLITTKYVLIVPDSTRVKNDVNFRNIIKEMDYLMSIDKKLNMFVWSVKNEELRCVILHFDIKRWTLNYIKSNNNILCHGASNEKELVILISKNNLFNLKMPYQKPVNLNLFITNALNNHKLHIKPEDVFSKGFNLFEASKHDLLKHNNLLLLQKKKLLESFGIKKINYFNETIENYGCNRKTSRCFDTIVNSTPDYLIKNRWTPPCCLNNLRTVARHVFKKLEACQARYWLEGGSLLGAVRNHDIIEWDYDVDVGIYENDANKCELLQSCVTDSIEDEEGYIWEKAKEGDFYRVQFSSSNHLHVDIFPFVSRNGTMTKRTWFKEHRQDREFPEKYLKPLQKINFIGVETFAPNNAVEFLEYKFGKGVVENWEYPNGDLV